MTLQDDHIWNLAKEFPEEHEIWNLGLQVLTLPGNQVASIWNKHKPEANLAARELLQKWSSQYESRREAYTCLYHALTKNGMNQRARLLKQWVEGAGTNQINLTPQRLKEIQELTKQSLKNKPFCLAVGKEWEEKQRKMDLRDIHTKLSWTRKHRKASGFKRRNLDNITQIFSHCQLDEDGPFRILVQAEGGMGKSTAMKHLAISWGDGTSDELKKFHFVFHLALKHVKKNSGSIEDIIIAQHSRLKAKKVKPVEIRSILEGDTSKVLLLIDGHDEYKTGYNEDIDEAIKKERFGDIWIILTSRETEQLYDVKQYMDAEVEIRGFDMNSVKTYIYQYMEDERTAVELIKQTEAEGMSFYNSIFNVPMQLNMICSLFEGTTARLPRTRVGLLGSIVQKCVNREAMRSKDRKVIPKAEGLNIDAWPTHISQAFLKLGELAWEKLNEPGKNLIFEKSEVVDRAGPEALELGLLFGTEIPQEEEMDALCFQHLVLQEFAASAWISRQGIKTWKKLFPRWEIMLKHKDVLSFVYGLSDHSGDVIDLICDKGATYFAENALKEFEQKCWNPDPADLAEIKAETHRHTHVILYHIDELIQKVKAEKTFNLRNRYLSVCGLDCSDFILSRTYIIKQFGVSNISFICPDPATNYDNGAKNNPVPYVIGSPHGDWFFRPLVKIMRTLCRYQKIVITRVYSPNMCLKEKHSYLEGHLVLDVSSEQSGIISFIKEIELLTFQRIFFTGFKMSGMDERRFEQVRRWVRFNPNMKVLELDGFNPPASLIEHIAQELYGEVECQNSCVILPNETTVQTPKEQSAGSSLQLLSVDFGNSKSTQDIKTLVRLNHLPQLRVLHLQDCGTHSLRVFLDSRAPFLEKLSLKYVTLSKQDINTFLNILTQGGFPKLSSLNLYNIISEYVKISWSDVRTLSNYGLEIQQPEGLKNLEYWNNFVEVYSALKRDILCKTKLNESDTRSLCRAMLPTFTGLDLSNNSLSGCLGGILKSDIFLNLRVLDLSNTNLCSINDVRALSTAACKGKLRTLNMSKNTLTDSLGILANEFPFLQTLLLEDTKLSMTDVQALSTAAQEGKLRGLRTLNLSKNTLTGSLGVLLANEFKSLDTLLLDDTKLSITDVQALSTAAQEGKLPWLRTLNLSKNMLTDTLHDLLKGNFRLLETLLLEDTKLSTSDVQALFTAVWEGKLQRLETLNLSKNILTDTKCDLVKCRFENLKELLFEDTKLSISDVRALSMAPWMNELRVLNLSKNILTESLVLIVDNKMPHLETLLLEDTVLSTRDILALSSAVRKGKLPALRHLNISQQNVCDLELPVMNLIRGCATDVKKKMQVNISLSSYGREFQQDVRSICAESKVNVL